MGAEDVCTTVEVRTRQPKGKMRSAPGWHIKFDFARRLRGTAYNGY